LEMLDQYEEVLSLLDRQPVKRQGGEDHNEWRKRLIVVVRTVWAQSSLGWKFPAPESDYRPVAVGQEHPLTAEEIQSLNEPIVREPVALPDARLQTIVRYATSRFDPKERRRSTKSRLAYRLLAEHWGISHGKIRGRAERMQKREGD
jgi:hypothetical protein